MNQEQTNITTGKQIRHLRTQLGMTQEELAGELNVTRQALSNWERDVNEPDLNMLKKICFLFGVNMDDFAKEVITKMETYEKKEKRQFNKYDMAIGLFLQQKKWQSPFQKNWPKSKMFESDIEKNVSRQGVKNVYNNKRAPLVQW